MKKGEPIISLDKVSVIYNEGKSNEVRSLVDASIKIYPQEYVIIFGPSGCGKSTLLYTISGLQVPTRGSVSVKGKKLEEMNKSEKVNLHQSIVGMIFQAFYLIPSLTILDNVCLPKVFRGEATVKRRAEGIKLLQRFSIVEQANKFPSFLSGGQKQRSSIARALANNPEIILADEPVGNLDSESSENVLHILKELNEVDKKTIILVTHNAEHLHFADRVIHMIDGRITKEEVYQEKRPEYVMAEKEKVSEEPVSDDVRILMRTFRNLSPQQIGALLVPFKTNQLMNHILSELTEEQTNVGGAFLKELLFGNIDLEAFQRNLDMDYTKGGAGWNKKRAESFVKRVGGVLAQAKMLNESDERKAIDSISYYLINLFKLRFNEEEKLRFDSTLRLRVGSKLDQTELRKKLNTPKVMGGMGLRKNIAEKVARELEIIMLIKYSV